MQKFHLFLMTLHMQMISHILALIVKGIMRLDAVHCLSALELMLITLIDDEDTPVVKNFGDSASCGFQLDETLHEKKLAEKSESSYEEIKSSVQKELGYEGNEKNAIRILEQPLEEEHVARAVLYLELEKERSAAATAADEAMAMILRLQDKKASIEMEAWQYQRII
ncbi:unnamed protein product [Camellia sinensis]